MDIDDIEVRRQQCKKLIYEQLGVVMNTKLDDLKTRDDKMIERFNKDDFKVNDNSAL